MPQTLKFDTSPAHLRQPTMPFSSDTSLFGLSLATNHKLTESDIAVLQPHEFSTRFKVVVKLGSGAFGDVHCVKDSFCKLGRALKVLQQTTGRQSSPAPEVMLFREARALKHAKHKNIVELISILRIPRTPAGPSPAMIHLWQQQQGKPTLHKGSSKTHGAGCGGGSRGGSRDVDKHQGSYWAMLLEFMECGSLASVIMKQMTYPHLRQYTYLDALTWALDIASGVEHLHGLNPMIIHRDLKSENILLQKSVPASNGSSGSRQLPVAKISDLGLHVMLDKPPCSFLIQSDGGGPFLVFKQQVEEEEGQEQQVKGQWDDDSSNYINSRALDGCTDGPKAWCGYQGQSAGTTTPAAAAVALIACALPTSKDARGIKHVAFSDLSQQQQQQADVKEASAHNVSVGATGSSSSDSSAGLVSAGVAEPNSGRQQQQLVPLTIKTLRRLSMESSCSGSAALGTPHKPGSVHGGSHQGIAVTVQAAAKGSGFCRAAVSAAAVSGSNAVKTSSAAAAAAAGRNDISVMLAAANSERDYQVSISNPGDNPLRRSSSTPQTPRGGPAAAADRLKGTSAAAASARSCPGSPKGLKTVSSTSSCVDDVPTAASMLWDDMMENYCCQDLLDEAASLSPTVLAYDLTHHTGSCMYMAPEVYKGQPYNEAVDVFSLGVILYELFSRSLLLYTHTPATSPADSMRYAKRVSQGYRPQCPKNVPKAVWQVIDRCWSQDPCARPSAAWVKQQLQQLLDAEEAGAAAKGGLRWWLQRGKPPVGAKQPAISDSADSTDSSGSSSTMVKAQVSTRSPAASKDVGHAPGAPPPAAVVCKDPLIVAPATSDLGPQAALDSNWSSTSISPSGQPAGCGCVIC